jgi:hypothetical protein
VPVIAAKSTIIPFALKKVGNNRWKVKNGKGDKKELSQVLGPPHHEQPIAGSTRRSSGNVGRLYPYFTYWNSQKKLQGKYSFSNAGISESKCLDY